MQKNKIMHLQWNVTHSRNHSVHLQVTVEYNSQQKSVEYKNHNVH